MTDVNQTSEINVDKQDIVESLGSLEPRRHKESDRPEGSGAARNTERIFHFSKDDPPPCTPENFYALIAILRKKEAELINALEMEGRHRELKRFKIRPSEGSNPMGPRPTPVATLPNPNNSPVMESRRTPSAPRTNEFGYTVASGGLFERPTVVQTSPAPCNIQDFEARVSRKDLQAMVSRAVEMFNESNRKLSYTEREINKFIREQRSSPFLDAIQSIVIHQKIRLPELNSYDGTGCPKAHIIQFINVMKLVSREDGIMCRLMASTFDGQAYRWFKQLPSGSITSFHELCTNFLNQYLYNSYFYNI